MRLTSTKGYGDMAEPFPDIPGWLVWGIIVCVILIGTVCLSALIAGICTGKWWLVSIGVAFCVLYYFKVLRQVLQ
jgi:hypothetical protein